MLAEHAVRERPGLRMHVALRLAERLSQVGRDGEAIALLEPVLAGLATTTPFDIAPARVWQIAAGVLTGASLPVRAAEARRAADDWIARTRDERVRPRSSATTVSS